MVMLYLLIAVSIAACNSAEIRHTLVKGLCPTEGQVFQNCAKCPATCSEPDLICDEQCTPGCGCPDGELINTLNNKCVKPKECPRVALPSKCALVLCAVPDCLTTAVPPGECCPVCVCQAGGKTYFPNDSFKQDCNNCTCTSTGLIGCTNKACQSGGIQREGKRRITTRYLCSGNQIFSPCRSACPLTCSSIRVPVFCPPHACIPGCECRDGFVLNEATQRCVSQGWCYQ